MVCPPGERLLAHIEGLGSEMEHTELERHLRDCQTCREEVALLNVITQALRRTTGSAVPDTVCTRSDELVSYADGRLDLTAAADFEEHLAHCGDCLAELGDVWAVRESREYDGAHEVVARVMRRLMDERRTLLIRISEKAVTAARIVGTSLEGLAGWSVVPELPVAAAARSRRSVVHVLWREEGGTTVEYLIEYSSGVAELTGHVESGGRQASAISVALSNDDGTRGPESPDAAGRFGPWRLAPGRNTISLSGVPIGGGLSHHSIDVDAVRN